MSLTEIIQSPSHHHHHHLPSPSRSITCAPSANNDVLHQQQSYVSHYNLNNGPSPSSYTSREPTERDQEGIGSWIKRKKKKRDSEEDQPPALLASLASAFRNSLVGCRGLTAEEHQLISSSSNSRMEISWPTNVRHVAHVTFDRFNGFLGVPVEFEPDIPRRPPSASTSVFGVSTESMQLSFDSRGNSIPTILLMMQRRLYAQGGLQAEGIFRINPENEQEEQVREQLNSGVIPDEIDVHCLAGLIKAWFRELPSGLLDSFSPEQVMQAETEEQCAELVGLLPSTENALLDWAINLMADVAQLEVRNKMNARNIAMVFAPNMTHMADPLTALMHAVQVMNFLKNLIVKTMREREESSAVNSSWQLSSKSSEPSDDHGEQLCSSPTTIKRGFDEGNDGEITGLRSPSNDDSEKERGSSGHGFLYSIENLIPVGQEHDSTSNTGSRKLGSESARKGNNRSRYRRAKRISPNKYTNLNDGSKGFRLVET